MSTLRTQQPNTLQVNGKELQLLPASNVEAMFGAVDLSRDIMNDADCETRMFQFGGAKHVLEAVAHGRLPNEVAIQLGLPLLWFDRWCEANVDGGDMARALTLAAETLVVKAQMVLAVDAHSTHEAAQARALSAEFIRVAEKLDHQKWGSRRADGLAGQTVNIQMNLGGGNKVESAVTVDLDPANREVAEAQVLPEHMSFEPMDPDAPPPIFIDLSCEIPDEY